MANYEQLFLLEVLVDRVKLLTTALEAFAPECEDDPESPVRIRVKFSDFPCFEITQDLAPAPKEKKDSDPLTTPIVFSSGKSCMFPMDPEQLIQDLIKYPMAVTVFKKNPESPVPEIIGQSKVHLGDYMSNIIKRAAEWSLEEPLSEMIQDTFPLRNSQDQDVGTITMLIRLTCFGKTIITKFQITGNKKSFLFKNAKTQDYEFKCKKCMPGQPIVRPRAHYDDDADGEEEEEERWAGDDYGLPMEPSAPYPVNNEVQEQYVPPCTAERAAPGTFPPTPGFQRHEGPGFTASMEVKYPEDWEDNNGEQGRNHPSESQSAPTVKKEHSGKCKRGKSTDSKKINAENGVRLGTQKRKKKTKFYVPQGIAYPGVILGHKYCVAQGPPIPPRNGWAWKTTVPLGMKWEDMRGWRPGAYLKQAWATIKAVEEHRLMGKRKKIKRKPALPDTRKTTVHIHRIKGIYHVTVNPIKGPDEKEDPEPIVYTLERPEDGSDASELEMDLTVPDPPYPPPPLLKHQAQQFCEEDLPLILPKPAFVKKKKKKEKPPVVSSKKKPGSGKSKGRRTPKKAKSKDTQESKTSAKKDKKGGTGGKGTPSGKGGDKGQGVKGSTMGKKTPTGKDASGGKGSATAKDGKGGAAKKDAKGTPAKGGGSAKSGTASKAPSTPQSKTKKKTKGKKKGDDDDDVYPWDDWIMKLKCKNKQTPED